MTDESTNEEILINVTPSEVRAAVLEKFPTCALAELRFDAKDWRDLTLGCELASYEKALPRRLASPEAPRSE